VLADQHAAAAASWPTITVSLARYLEHLAHQVRDRSSEPAERVVRTMPGADLYLAAACSDGDAAALAAFRAQLVPSLRQALGKLAMPAPAIDETVQRVLVMLFVGDGKAAPQKPLSRDGGQRTAVDVLSESRTRAAVGHRVEYAIDVSSVAEVGDDSSANAGLGQIGETRDLDAATPCGRTGVVDPDRHVYRAGAVDALLENVSPRCRSEPEQDVVPTSVRIVGREIRAGHGRNLRVQQDLVVELGHPVLTGGRLPGSSVQRARDGSPCDRFGLRFFSRARTCEENKERQPGKTAWSET
jgi:hypothetical protein